MKISVSATFTFDASKPSNMLATVQQLSPAAILRSPLAQIKNAGGPTLVLANRSDIDLDQQVRRPAPLARSPAGRVPHEMKDQEHEQGLIAATDIDLRLLPRMAPSACSQGRRISLTQSLSHSYNRDHT